MILVADQITKNLVMKNIPLNTSIKVFSLLDINHLTNRGAAFSFFAASDYANYFLMPIALGAVCAIGYWLYFHGHKENKINQYALLFIMAGAAGNFVDRARFGHVIDFISVHYKDWYYPSFNVADSSISIGAVLLIFGLFYTRNKTELWECRVFDENELSESENKDDRAKDEKHKESSSKNTQERDK